MVKNLIGVPDAGSRAIAEVFEVLYARRPVHDYLTEQRSRRTATATRKTAGNLPQSDRTAAREK